MDKPEQNQPASAPSGMPEKRFGLQRLIPAIRHSLQGLMTALKSEAAFRQEVALFCILTPVALWLGDTGVERALLVGSMVVVLIVELLNTAVEYAVNRFGYEYNELVKAAKDTGSAAVFLSLGLVVLTWALILFFP